MTEPHRPARWIGWVPCLLSLLAAHLGAQLQPLGSFLVGEQKVSSVDGGFNGALNNGDAFGRSLASLGDLDGDGFPDVAVGAHLDDDGGSGRGAVWILKLKDGGLVKSHAKISATSGGFTGALDDSDYFGYTVASLGDLDGDGVIDLAVGAILDDDGGASGNADTGAVWILFLNADLTVKSHTKISATSGGFTGTLDVHDWFGSSLASLGDLDGDGVTDLAVGAIFDDDAGADLASNLGAVWILYLNPDGTVKNHAKISAASGGFAGALDNADAFGSSLAPLGDLDGDGVADLAVGAMFDDDFLKIQVQGEPIFKSGGPDSGAIWVLFLNADGTVKSEAKISALEGNLSDKPLDRKLGPENMMGASLICLGDLDGSGFADLAVGAPRDDEPAGSTDRGAVWILFLDATGAVSTATKINEVQGGFQGTLLDGDWFGSSLAWIDDVSGNGSRDLMVGALSDDDGGSGRGAVWSLHLRANNWTDLGESVPGTNGDAVLTTDGNMEVGTTTTFSLDNALENATATLVLGTSLLNAPFAGGVLVPSLDFLSPSLPTDATGALEMQGTWAAGAPPGFLIYLQFWFADAGAAFGWGASNAASGLGP